MNKIISLSIVYLCINNLLSAQVNQNDLNLNRPIDIELRLIPDNAKAGDSVIIVADITYIVSCNGVKPEIKPGTTATSTFYEDIPGEDCNYTINFFKVWGNYPDDSCSLDNYVDTLTPFQKVILPNCCIKCIYEIPAAYNLDGIYDTLTLDFRTNKVKYEKLSHFNLYPNPAKDFIYIQNNDDHNSCKIELFNVNGNLLLKKEFIGFNNRIDISAFPDGIYIIKLSNSNESEITKFIKF